MLIFDYSTAKQSDSIVVLAGGESTGINKDRIVSYIRENNSLVFSANYDYGIKSDYTYFGDYVKFLEQIGNIKNGEIIISNRFPKKASRGGLKFYTIKAYGEHGIYRSSRVQIGEDGSFPYCIIGTSGMACIVLACLCRPKKMLLVGFDGSVSDASVKKKFDGSVVKYGKPEKRAKEIKYLTNSLAPSLCERGIIVETFGNVLFYGIPKNNLGFRII